MSAALPPMDEVSRQRLLADLVGLAPPAEAGLDALVRTLCLATGWPLAALSLKDAHRQWIKASAGLAGAGASGDQPLGEHLLEGSACLEVAEALADPRFNRHPMVIGPPHVRAYAGVAIRVQDLPVGSVCVMHTCPARLETPLRELVGAVATSAAALLEERLNRSRLVLQRDRLRDIAAAAGDWLWETDERHAVCWLSDSFERSVGQRASMQLGLPWPDGPLVGTQGQPIWPTMTLQQLCEARQPFSRATVRFSTPSGVRWVSFSGVPFSDPASRPRGMRGSARDVTELVLNERARHQEAERLRTLVDVVPGALYQFRVAPDGSACFPFASRGLTALFDVSPETAAQDAQPVFDRIHPADLSRIQRSIELSQHELSAWHGDFRVNLPRGMERHLTAHSTPQREPDGSVVWHGLVTDDTQRVMEGRERERLQRERDDAQRSARARTEALSRMSHELRTPLNAILGFTQLMQAELNDAGRTDGPWPQWVRQVRRASTHLLALVNGVLDLSSLEARRFAVDIQPVDAVGIAREVADLVRPQAQQRRQCLDVVEPTQGQAPGDRGTPWVLADKRALRQVLINLLGNASKYTQEQGRLTLRCQVQNASMRLEVADDGPGISDAEQARLFRPFERGSEAKRATDGTGLGLVISRQLVRAMGGQLTLNSAPGRGAVFGVELPLADAAPDLCADSQSAESLFGALDERDAGQTTMPAGQLLYVEDDPVNGLLMQEFVARNPPLVMQLCVTVAAGLAAARRRAPDLVLLDMHLPDGTGYQALRQLRADPATAALRVVALSADAMPEQIERARSAGFDDYWTKPIDFALLRRRLVALLDTNGETN